MREQARRFAESDPETFGLIHFGGRQQEQQHAVEPGLGSAAAQIAQESRAICGVGRAHRVGFQVVKQPLPVRQSPVEPIGFASRLARKSR